MSPLAERKVPAPDAEFREPTVLMLSAYNQLLRGGNNNEDPIVEIIFLISGALRDFCTVHSSSTGRLSEG